MNEPTIDAGTLAGAYLAMAQLFSYPNPAAWQRLTAHGVVDPAMTRDELEAEFLAAFEVGRDTPPVPLFEGMHRGEMGRDGIIEDLMRFYEFFDVKLNETDREYPDHLATELEFLAWLCMQEQEAERRGGDAEPFRRAASDFLDRHVGAWVPDFHERVETTGSVYGEYSANLAGLVQRHRTRLNEQSNPSEA